jgi:hypothetical protein
MRTFEKWFPVAFALPFLFATTMLEFLQLPSELGRWAVLVLAAGSALVEGRRTGAGFRWFDWTALAVLGFFSASALWAIDEIYSFQRTISLGLLYVGAFWYWWGWVDRFGQRLLIERLVRTAAVVLAANLVLFGALDPGSILERRFQGFFENPNNIGLVCSVGLPLAFALLLRRRGAWEIAGFAVLSLSLLVCGSRTGLVAAGAAMALIGGLRALRGNKAAIGFVVGVGAMLFAVSLTNYFDENVARTESLETLSNRTHFWELAKLDYIPERPWLGHGFGTDALIHDYYGITLSDLQLRGYGVMSSYYGLAVAVGVPATVFFFAVMWLGTAWLLYRHHQDGWMVTAAATVVAGLLVGITESSIYSVGSCFAYQFWIAVMLTTRRGVVLGQRRTAATNAGKTKRRRRRPRRAVAKAGLARFVEVPSGGRFAAVPSEK